MSKVESTTRAAGGCWRRIIKGGRRAVKSPSGRIYYGTAEELRGCALVPSWRRHVAQRLRVARHCFADGAYSRDDLREALAEVRRDAIAEHATTERSFSVSATGVDGIRWEIEVSAAARANGCTADDFVRRCVASGIEAARTRCLGRLPFSRQEADALVHC